MKVSRKEIGVAAALGLAVALFSILYDVALQIYSDYLGSHSAARSPLGESAEFLQRVRIMDADIERKLENGTFEAVVPYIKALTREKAAS